MRDAGRPGAVRSPHERTNSERIGNDPGQGRVRRCLQVGFGEAGASIIGRNMRSGDGDLNIMIPGERIQAIFGFCDIRSFTEITECLQVRSVFLALLSGLGSWDPQRVL